MQKKKLWKKLTNLQKNTCKIFNSIIRTMFVTFITSITIILIWWASFIASFSLPWEVFYPIKIHWNEKLVSAIAISSESEAQLQLNLIKERIDERNKLIATWNLSEPLNKQITNQIDYHTDILQFHLWKISENKLTQQIQSELNWLIESVERQTSFLNFIER